MRLTLLPLRLSVVICTGARLPFRTAVRSPAARRKKNMALIHNRG